MALSIGFILLNETLKVCSIILIKLLYNSIFPMLENSSNETGRSGAIETIYSLLSDAKNNPEKQELLVKISPHLLIPILRKLNDPCIQVSYVSSYCLSQIIYYVPGNFCEAIHEKTDEYNLKELRLLNNLLNPMSIDSYTIPFDSPVKLRSYQQDGISWLNFLRELNLNGALCDGLSIIVLDMGLGKTIQSLAIISSDHYEGKVTRLEPSFSNYLPKNTHATLA
ncbi:LOW QUALITY PROTEIN: hypothetical protein MXB_152 [Myxobolus squamalis]|nr:LOW QUALITY PROTEIN: hypothetical protein MXB_152 [Myxobolus squamalis]